MSVSGTGTQNDPYIVTTWAELVAKAAENGKYVRVGNNIDVMQEYDDGTAPTLVLNGSVDGDGKTISRWYNTGSNYLIRTKNSTVIENAIFTNIKTSYSLIYNLSDQNHDHITVSNCKFAGIMADGYIFDGSRDTRGGKVNRVAINIKGANLKLVYYGSSAGGVWWNNLNVKLDTSATILCERYYQDYFSNSSMFYDSYFDITAPNLTNISDSANNKRVSFENCVLDIKTDNAVTFDTANTTLSIFNSTNAPNAVGTAGKIVGVDDTHWLDAEYLEYTVGFNIVEEE